MRAFWAVSDAERAKGVACFPIPISLRECVCVESHTACFVNGLIRAAADLKQDIS